MQHHFIFYIIFIVIVLLAAVVVYIIPVTVIYQYLSPSTCHELISVCDLQQSADDVYMQIKMKNKTKYK